jgi:hypothetical protein
MQFVMKFTEFEEFAMMAFLINCDTGPNGEMLNQPSSNICTAMLDSCMEMRGHVSTDPVISYQCINLPFLVQDTLQRQMYQSEPCGTRWDGSVLQKSVPSKEMGHMVPTSPQK